MIVSGESNVAVLLKVATSVGKERADLKPSDAALPPLTILGGWDERE
jgi:hypothetical protein